MIETQEQLKESKELINVCYNIDCLEFMKSCKSEMFDCIITDPPFDVDLKEKMKVESLGFVYRDYVEFSYDYNELSTQFYRILKDNSYCLIFMGDNQIINWITNMEKAGFIFTQHLVWKKNNSILSMSIYRMSYITELCMVFRKGKPSPIDNSEKGKGNVFNYKIVNNKFHPCQKPTALLAHLIRIYTKKYDLIFDAFAGSGSTLKASKELNRSSIGCELLNEYVEKINHDLKQVLSSKIYNQKTII